MIVLAVLILAVLFLVSFLCLRYCVCDFVAEWADVDYAGSITVEVEHTQGLSEVLAAVAASECCWKIS